MYIIVSGMSDISLETTRIQVRPMGDQKFVMFTFLVDEVTNEVNESLTLQLVPTPATLQTMPIGEGVFFKQQIPLIIMDAERKLEQHGFIYQKNYWECQKDTILYCFLPNCCAKFEFSKVHAQWPKV